MVKITVALRGKASRTRLRLLCTGISTSRVPPLERAGHPQAALDIYRQLYVIDHVRKEIVVKIDSGIARITGEPPPRMLKRMGRSYTNDPMPRDADPYSFHLASLLNFNVRYAPRNAVDAFAYILDLAQVGVTPEKHIFLDVVKVRDRLAREFRALKQDIATYGYTFSSSATMEITATENMLEAHRLVATHALANGLFDRALVELNDAEALMQKWRPNWLYDLRSRVYGRRDQTGDLELAGKNMRLFIEKKVAYGGALDWTVVKTHPDYAALRNSELYARLMRGR